MQPEISAIVGESNPANRKLPRLFVLRPLPLFLSFIDKQRQYFENVQSTSANAAMNTYSI